MAGQASTKYKTLSRNIFLLKKALLPASKPNGNYTVSEVIAIRSFRVMAHAELEYYLEGRCTEVLEATRNASNARENAKIVGALKRHSAWQEALFASKKNGNQLLGDYKDRIKKNHGVKETNLFGLLTPLGISIDKINPALVATLDSYGAVRGVFAHNSITHVGSGAIGPLVIDSSIEERAINSICANLRVIDRVFTELLM